VTRFLVTRNDNCFERVVVSCALPCQAGNDLGLGMWDLMLRFSE